MRLTAVQEEDGQDEVADEQQGQAHDAVTHCVVAESKVIQNRTSCSISIQDPINRLVHRSGKRLYGLPSWHLEPVQYFSPENWLMHKA